MTAPTSKDLVALQKSREASESWIWHCCRRRSGAICVFLRNIKLVVRGSGAFANCRNLCNWQHWETVICYYNTGISGVRIGLDWLFFFLSREVFAKTFQRHNLPNIKSWSGLQSAWLLLRWENVWTCVNYYVNYYVDYYDYILTIMTIMLTIMSTQLEK